MTSIKVNILGKQYPLRVEEDEVETTHEIARYVNQRMKKYRRELPQQSITTVMVMAAMSLAEEAIETGENTEESRDSERVQQINSQLEEMLDELQEEAPQSDEKDQTQDPDDQ